MFANLKNKIFEEVKASPQKFQQFAQAAQAAVSSTSSNASDSVSGSDNFFSITEEDTPQNSPHKVQASGGSKTTATPSSSKQPNAALSFVNNGVPINRSRRLSNSSMASDVSFRLPSYDSPAIYHLQSDLDVSASEVEDSATSSNIQLDVISKEQLYSAYKKSLERYQKYRSRFTDLAKRYRDLEHDSTKARSVLVETQDKAIRRISELREQCSLEQQAKAHLEEALRLEMDDMQCKLKAYETKLNLLGENPENVTDFSRSQRNPEESLIQLDCEDDVNARIVNEGKTNDDPSVATTNETIGVTNEKLVKLEELVAKYKKQLSENTSILAQLQKENDTFKAKQQECDTLISSLKNREEENSILLAENKLMVHTELENKESEVKNLKNKILVLEKNNNQEQLIAELQHRIAKKEQALESAIKQRNEHEQKLNQIEKENKELRAIQIRKVELEKELENVAKQLSELQILLEAKKEMEEKVKKENQEFRLQISNLNKDLNESRAQIKSTQNAIIELKAELESNKIVAKTQESAAVSSVQKALDELKEKSLAEVNRVESLLSQKEEDYKQLEGELTSIKNNMTVASSQLPEDSILKNEVSHLNEQIEKLKNDHTEREIQMEKEKLELQSQVTNILQEIGRMEIQMKEVRTSHDQLEEEKRALERKIEKMTKQNLASQEGQHKWERLLQEAENNAKQLESKMKVIETENSQLAEKNCLQEENLKRFEMQMKHNDSVFKREKLSLNNILKEAEANYCVLRLELETAKETSRKLTEKMSQVLDENSRLLNAKEIMEHEFRSLQDQCESREKEKLCVLDSYKCLEEEVNRLKQENIGLAGGSDEDKKQLQTLLAEIKIANESKNNWESHITSLEDEIRILKSKEDETEILMQERDALKGELERLNVQIESISSKTNLNDETVNELREKIDEISKENIALKEQNQSYCQEIAALGKRNEDRLEELQRLLKQANDEKELLQETIQNASELEKKLQNYEEQKIENQYLNTSIHQLELDIKSLKEQHSEKDLEIVELKEKVKSQQCELYVCVDDKVKHESDLKVMEEELTKSNEEKLKLSETLAREQEDIIRQKGLSAFVTNENDQLKKDLIMWQQKVADTQQIAEDGRIRIEEFSNENLRLRNEMEDDKQKFKESYSQLTEENENHKSAVFNLTNQLTSINDKITQLEAVESFNRQLQDKVKELEVEIADKATAKVETVSEANKQQHSEMEALRHINARLQEELEELKQKTSNEILHLSHEIDDLTSSAKSMTEKLVEYEALKKRLQASNQDMNGLDGGNSIGIVPELESIRKDKEDLERKLEKIMHEVQDVSNINLFLEQKCENYLILEQSNERLKLANSKLSRQLDDTLVSLQHNEGISANTEFEYLRNIMFQYLTGSVTRNNSTLVKVIAAVLKFTPQQTQVAIEKENHRHTLVGQISNLL